MSYDLFFWKQEKRIAIAPGEVATKVCKKERVDGLANLPTREILARLAARFPEFNYDADQTMIRAERGSAEVYADNQHFALMVYGELGSYLNDIVDIMSNFDCPMYDPQEGERYDADGGTRMGEVPIFRDKTDEERRAIEKIEQDMLAKFEAAGRKKQGCAGLVFLFASIVLTCVFAFIYK